MNNEGTDEEGAITDENVYTIFFFPNLDNNLFLP